MKNDAKMMKNDAKMMKNDEKTCSCKQVQLPVSTAVGLLKREIGEVLDTISDPNIPAERLLWAGVVQSSPGGTRWHAARYFLSERMLA